MKKRQQNLRWVPLMGLLPLLVGLGYAEANLPLSPDGHTLVQLLMVGIIFSLAFLWVRGNQTELLDRYQDHPTYTILVDTSLKVSRQQKEEHHANVHWN
jgi:hypothetical protein